MMMFSKQSHSFHKDSKIIRSRMARIALLIAVISIPTPSFAGALDPNAFASSGGGIFLHAPTISIDPGSLISAQGGNGGPELFVGGPGGGSGGGGGGGGGGQVVLDAHSYNFSLNQIDVLGGNAGNPYFGATSGGNGVLGQYEYYTPAAVPEPSSILMVTVAAAIGLGWSRRRKRPPSKS